MCIDPTYHLHMGHDSHAKGQSLPLLSSFTLGHLQFFKCGHYRIEMAQQMFAVLILHAQLSGPLTADLPGHMKKCPSILHCHYSPPEENAKPL